ncbi:MAG: hypothetical protein QW042_05020 [Thermoplasmata archaeon]
MKKKKKITISVDAICVDYLKKYNIESISRICQKALLDTQKEIELLISLANRKVISENELQFELLRYQNYEEYKERKKQEDDKIFIEDFEEKRRIANTKWTS